VSGRRAAFRAWRHSCPFWGGLLLLIAGIELLSLPLTGVLGHGGLKLVIYIGIGGVFGVLIGILLVAAGIMCWVSPVHRVFYGIVGVALGIASFPASNLGGFFIGMLLAIVGGALAFAWERIDAAPVAAADAAPAVEPDAAPAVEPAAPQDPRGVPRPPGRSGSHGSRALAAATMPALLAAGVLTAPGHADGQTPSGICILGIICFGSSPSPSPSPSSSPSPAIPLPIPGLSPGSSSGGSASQGAGAGTGTAAGSNSTTPAKRAADPGLMASSATSVLTAGSATLSHFSFAGIVKMHVAGGGTAAMMKFTASSAVLTNGVNVTVTQGGSTSVTQSPTLTFSGGMTLYATKLSGDLGPIPLTFTPSTVSSLLLHIANLITAPGSITLTNVTTDQPLAIAGGLQTGALSIVS
jgi:hypothetical protein